MFIGRFQLGDFLPLSVQCMTSSGEVAPTAAPNYTIYNSSDTIVTGADDVKLPPLDKSILTGWFAGEHQLGSNFSNGIYTVRIEWASGGSNYAKVFGFQIVPGGNSTGAYIGMEFFTPPHANYVVGMSDAGTVEGRKNPRV